jgi:hypothetical protein
LEAGCDPVTKFYKVRFWKPAFQGQIRDLTARFECFMREICAKKRNCKRVPAVEAIEYIPFPE